MGREKTCWENFLWKFEKNCRDMQLKSTEIDYNYILYILNCRCFDRNIDAYDKNKKVQLIYTQNNIYYNYHWNAFKCNHCGMGIVENNEIFYCDLCKSKSSLFFSYNPNDIYMPRYCLNCICNRFAILYIDKKYRDILNKYYESRRI